MTRTTTLNRILRHGIAVFLALAVSGCGAGSEALTSAVNSAIQTANAAAESQSESSVTDTPSTTESNEETAETTQSQESNTENLPTGNEDTEENDNDAGDENTSQLTEPSNNSESASSGSDEESGTGDETDNTSESESQIALAAINNEDLYDYEGLLIPGYITKDNTTTNTITNAGATLGRVLFYDTALSSDDTVSCASCHQQALGFSDSDIVSDGVNGVTGRHSMRLINTRFSEEANFFWDERADTLEEQTTQPIKDHGEMGFSGENGAPDFNQLIVKLEDTSYYPTLFTMAFGNSVISEEKLQDAMAQFIRSIQSFDSRYDLGRAQVGNDNNDFANFTALENQGKQLFLRPPNFNAGTGERLAGSGLGCNGCHRAPEFDIDSNSRNNGVITVAGDLLATDLTNTRSPTLRDLFASDGTENGPFMHDGSLATFNDVLNHYNDITHDPNINPSLDNRLRGGAGGGGPNNGPGQKLLLTATERDAVVAFMQTLSGNDVYSDPMWSDPFQPDGSLSITQ